MAVQARFYVANVRQFAARANSGYAVPAPQIEVELYPVNGGKNAANKEWASATPSGNVKLTVGNPDAAQWFVDRLGKDVAITFDDRPEGEID